MIATSRRIGLTALLMASALHLGGVAWLVLNEQTLIAGGQAGAAEASLGAAFEELVAGTLTGQETTEVIEEVPVKDMADAVELDDTAERVEPQDLAEVPEPAERTEQVQSDEAEQAVQTTQSAAAPQTSELVEAVPAQDRVARPVSTPTLAPNIDNAEAPPEQTFALAATPELDASDTIVAVTATEALKVRTLTPLRALTPTQEPTPQQLAALSPVQPLVSETPQTLTAQEPEQNQGTESLRPKVRSRAFEERHKPEPAAPQPRRTTRATPQPTPAQRGNQAQDNREIGQEDGSATAAPARRATGGTDAARAGNAAVTNYPGQVMRKIQRVRRPRVGVKATATVAFRIAGGGGLGGVSIARSSGNAKLDQAALQVIRGAAPFPVTPPGTPRSFTIQIKGR